MCTSSEQGSESLEQIHERKKTVPLGIRFEKDVLEKLNDYARKYFQGSRSKAVNSIIKKHFYNFRKLRVKHPRKILPEGQARL